MESSQEETCPNFSQAEGNVKAALVTLYCLMLPGLKTYIH